MLKTKTSKLNRRQNGMLALEQRFMFDGAAIADAVDNAVDLQISAPSAVALSANLARAEVRAEQLVTDFLNRPDAREQLLILFKGEQSNDQVTPEWQAAVDQLLVQADQGQLNVRVELRSNAELQGAKGAFSASGTKGEATIYLNADWVATADSESVAIVLTEEMGHFLDHAINGDADTTGDEGEVFAQFLVNGTQPLPVSFDLTGNDHAILSLDEQQVLAELASFNFVNAYEMVYDRDNSTLGKNTAQITTGDIATTERWSDKEQNSHFFNASVSLGVVSITDGTNGQNFSGNDVSASTVVVGGNTYYGWISRPIKAGGVVRGFFFWTDSRFTTLALAQADGNQDGDSSVLNNRGFLFVVDQAWFNTQIAAGTANVAINNTKDGNLGSITVANVGSSSDRVDSALNSLIVPNSAPVAANDTLTVNEDSAMVTRSGANSLLSNDSDSNSDALTITSFSVGGTTTTLSSGTGTYVISGAGTITVRSDGSYDFTPAAGFSGAVAPITYTVSDGNGGSATAVLSISVTPVNDAPTANPDTKTISENTVASGTVIANDTDLDGNSLTVTGFTYSNGTSTVSGTIGSSNTINLNGVTVGTLILNASGTYSFTPTTNYSGAVPVFNYSISDGQGGTASSTLTISLTNLNNAPVANADNADGSLFAQAPGCASGTAVTETQQSGNVLTNDTDPDVTLSAGTTHSVTAVESQSGLTWNGTSIVGLYGTLTIGSNGIYSYNINETNQAVKSLRSTESLTEVFNYTMTEASGTSPLSASSTLRIVIKGANDAPTAINDSGNVQIVNASNPFDTTTGNVIVNDTDVDSTLTVNNISTVSSTYAVGVYTNSLGSENGTTVTSGNVSIVRATSGNVSNASSGTLTALSGTTVTINGTGNNMTFTLGSLDAIQAFKDNNPLGAGQSYYLYLYIANNKNGYVELGTATNTASSAVTGNTTLTGSYGTLQLDTTGAYTYTLTNNPGSGTYKDRFEYTVTDGSCTSKATLEITITGTTNLADTTVRVNEDSGAYTGILTNASGGAITIASFIIKNLNGTTSSGSFSTSTSITGGSISLDANGGYTFTPDSNYHGPVPEVTYTLSDGSKATLKIVVDPVNDAPAGTDKTVALTDQQTYQFTAYDFGFTDANDNPTDAFTNVKITTLPSSGILALNGIAVTSGQTISVANLHQLVFTPLANSGASANTSFTFQVQDDGGTTNSGVDLDPTANTFSFTVSKINDAPVVDLNGTDSGNNFTQTYTNGSTAVSIADSDSSVSDSDDDYIESATVRLINKQVGDTLTVGSLPSGMTAVVDTAVNGQITVTLTSTSPSTKTKSDYEAAIEAITFASTGTSVADRTISVQVNDGELNSNVAYSTIDVSADNRVVTVMGSVVNEASPYIMFEVSGMQNQWVSLSLITTGSGTGHASQGTDFLPNLEYLVGSSWTSYNGGLVQIADAGGNLLVRTAVLQDTPFESTQANYETLQLTATNANNTTNVTTDVTNFLADGTARIRDDGQGSIYLSSNTSFSNPNTSGAGFPAYLDDDRPVSVNNIAVNEASPWAMFTVTGYANQVLSLSLLDGTAKVGDGSPADGSEDYSPNLQYWNGTTWTAYNGTSVTLAGTTLLVRTAIHQDTLFEGQHTFNLGVTKLSSNTTVYGSASIYDDGTGNIYAFDNDNDGTVTITSGPGAGFDDDRTLTINSPLVNEASDYVVFTLTGNSGQTVSLQLQDESNNGTVSGKANILENQTLKIWDGLAWVNYDANNLPTFNANGKIFVRVNIIAEQDAPFEGGETFKLNATLTGRTIAVTGEATIVDDGTGVKFPGTFTNGLPTTNTTNLDNDQTGTISVTGGIYNEGSPRAVFTINASPGQALTLDVLDEADTGKAPTGDDEDGADDSLNNAPIYYSLDGGNTWQLYTGTSIIAGSVPVLVAVDINQESDNVYEGEEQFKLVVTSGNQSASAFGTILDDGTGKISPAITPSYSSLSDPTADLGGIKDDDRPLTVSSVTVNEGSPYAVFTVTGAANQQATLGLSGQNSDGANLSSLQYFDGTTWQNYTAGATVTLNSSGTLLVRVALSPEQEAALDGPEAFNLVATNTGGTAATGVGTIVDDGTGSYFAADNNSATPAVPAGIALDDDRPKAPPLIIEPVEVAPAIPTPLTPPQIVLAPVVPNFSSALNPLRSSIVVAEPPLPLIESITSGSGYQIPVSETAPIGLTLYQGVTDQFVQSTNTATKVSLPFDAFIHSNKDAVIKLNAKQADDSPLPNWVQFDPNSGVFEVVPPAGFKGKLNLKVIARDDDGREATAIFQMFIGEQTTDRPQSRSSFSDKLKTVSNRPLTLIQVSEMHSKLQTTEGKVLKVRGV